MFLDDALCVFRRNVLVPSAFRVHHTDRSIAADAEALTLRSIERTIGSSNVELLHPALQVNPRPLASFEIGTVRPQANEEVTRQSSDAEGLSCFLGRIRSLGHPVDDIAGRGTCFAPSPRYAKGVFMASRDMGRKSRNESRDAEMDRDERVRGRADEMEDASNESEEFEVARRAGRALSLEDAIYAAVRPPRA